MPVPTLCFSRSREMAIFYCLISTLFCCVLLENSVTQNIQRNVQIIVLNNDHRVYLALSTLVCCGDTADISTVQWEQ